ncbi:MAG: outer rane lipoprotein carrier protein LolA [Candidatus Acidoferrum typicum]|jgi:outer membrane lipoprotein carrier protein|nr:outer rane lipoprotein carrier protein LolA [Candidatus Acidoferrum typicum]
MLLCPNFLIILFLAVITAPDAKTVVQRLESKYRSVRTLKATFLERYTENGRVVRVEAGTAYFRRPGKMRWEYESPEKNVFLVDGKTAWFYVPADRTATRVPAKVSTDWRTPLALLAGEMKLSRVCGRMQLSVGDNLESPENVMLRCDLRGAADKSQKPDISAPATRGPDAGEAVFFEISMKSGDLVGVVVKDPGGVGVEFHFADWRFDPPLADAFFQFDAPPGVAIVNGELSVPDTGTKP